MERVFEESGIRVDFMSAAMQRALILVGYVVDKDFCLLVRKKIPNLPLFAQKSIETIGDHVSPECWAEAALQKETVESLSLATEPENEHLKNFIDLFTPEIPLSERYLVYLITYSKRDGKELRKYSNIRLFRAVTKKIQTFYKTQKDYDKGAIEFIFSALAAEN